MTEWSVPILLNKPEKNYNFSHIILPGVGSFGRIAENLKVSGFYEYLINNREKGNFILGICVGMQLLADKGFEIKETDGFGWIPGNVKKIPFQKNIKIPHMGWNTINFNKEHELLKNIKRDHNEMIAYFVHSYQFELESEDNLLGYCNYGSRITALVEKDNIIGCQFHPEKSQKVGLKFINNFVNWKP